MKSIHNKLNALIFALVLLFNFPLMVDNAFALSPTNSVQQAPTNSAPQANAKINYTVLSCNDGDTCKLKSSDNVTIKVRLVGIDAPEFKKPKSKKDSQPHAQFSKDFLNTLIQGKSVTLTSYGTDGFNRALAEIHVGALNVNLHLVQEGQAEVYEGRPPKGFQVEPYLEAQSGAKKERKGIWKVDSYESPALYRKKERKKD